MVETVYQKASDGHQVAERFTRAAGHFLNAVVEARSHVLPQQRTVLELSVALEVLLVTGDSRLSKKFATASLASVAATIPSAKTSASAPRTSTKRGQATGTAASCGPFTIRAILARPPKKKIRSTSPSAVNLPGGYCYTGLRSAQRYVEVRGRSLRRCAERRLDFQCDRRALSQAATLAPVTASPTD